MSLSEAVVAALNEYNEDAQDAVCGEAGELTRRNPLPEPGRYKAAFEELDAFVTESEDEAGNTIPFLNVTLSFKGMDGPAENAVIERTFWGNSKYDQAALFDFVSVMTGTKPTKTKEAVMLLDGKEGLQVELKVSTYTIKKGERKGESRKTLDIVG